MGPLRFSLPISHLFVQLSNGNPFSNQNQIITNLNLTSCQTIVKPYTSVFPLKSNAPQHKLNIQVRTHHMPCSHKYYFWLSTNLQVVVPRPSSLGQDTRQWGHVTDGTLLSPNQLFNTHPHNSMLRPPTLISSIILTQRLMSSSSTLMSPVASWCCLTVLHLTDRKKHVVTFSPSMWML